METTGAEVLHNCTVQGSMDECGCTGRMERYANGWLGGSVSSYACARVLV
jgi:hypothetical protein